MSSQCGLTRPWFEPHDLPARETDAQLILPPYRVWSIYKVKIKIHVRATKNGDVILGVRVLLFSSIFAYWVGGKKKSILSQHTAISAPCGRLVLGGLTYLILLRGVW